MESIKHSLEFDLVYRFATETNLNVFLTGKAGTGKTTFLKYLREHSYKNMVVAAPTGVAAINAGGVTLHSLFQLPFAPFIPGGKNINADSVNSSSLLSTLRLSNAKLELFRSLELLVIDEASMVASHTVDAIDTILRSVRRKHRQPFGGVQVLFIGDLHQLQPVVKNHEWEFLKDYYSSIFFFDSVVLRENVPVMIELKEIFRQKDETFVEVLNEVRNNCLSRKNFDLLNTRLNSNYFPDSDEGYITLTTHVRQAERINKQRLQRLDGYSQVFKATITGDYPEQLYPAEANLELKEGAQIMFLKNDNEGKKYFNGKLGIVTKLNDFVIKVKCKGEPEEIEVRKHDWKNINYTLNKDTREIIEDELGTFSQYPLRLAWAITIHKSQGLTFDKLIIDAANAFANGQVYVALSRCTSLEGLILTSPINQQFLGAHQNLEDWKQQHHSENNLQQSFEESRKNFVLSELQNIFTLDKWQDELRELRTLMHELKDDLPAECFTWMNELTTKQKELQQTAEKFKREMEQLCHQNPVVEENQRLQQRIKAAATYFSDNITRWKEAFNNHSLTTDTKKNAKKIDAALDVVNIYIAETLHKVNHCQNGFILDNYLKQGKKITRPIEKIQTSYAQGQTKNIIIGELVHEGLYDRIADMRRRIGGEKKLPLYTVFSNDAIRNICANLPANKDVLLKVKGFGKVKVEKYGDEVIELVLDYCNENKLEPQFRITSSTPTKKKDKSQSGLPSTVDETVTRFKSGKSIIEIAEERNLAIGTIEGHLGQAIENGSINLEDVMAIEEAKTIAHYFPKNLEGIYLASIKEKAPDISFGKLRIVLGWLQRKHN